MKLLIRPYAAKGVTDARSTQYVDEPNVSLQAPDEVPGGDSKSPGVFTNGEQLEGYSLPEGFDVTFSSASYDKVARF